jgi:hypothetical protein
VESRLFSAASLAQTLGMTFGNFITNAGVICGQTKQCHSTIFRSAEPISLKVFGFYSGLIHLVVTIVIIIFISEHDDESNDKMNKHKNDDAVVSHNPDNDGSHETTMVAMFDAKNKNKMSSFNDLESDLVGSDGGGGVMMMHQSEPTTVKEVITLIWAMSKRSHCRTLAWLLITSKFAFALSENGIYTHTLLIIFTHLVCK